MVVCADKLHNVRSLIDDLATVGDSVWERFRHGKDDQEWYYRSVLASLSHSGGFGILEELRLAVGELFNDPFG